MKLFYNISPLLKKITAVLLLSYFVISPLLFAFPVEECSASCPMRMETERGGMGMNEMTAHACNSEKQNVSISATDKSGVPDVSAKSCMAIKYFDSNFKSVITQKYESVSALTVISILEQFANENRTTINNGNTQPFQKEKSPPIYISIQTFLI